MGDVAQGIKSFKKGMSDEEEAPAKETKVIEHEGSKPAAKSASRAKAPRKQKTV
jgi:sec-independent protein translocase protein TatA